MIPVTVVIPACARPQLLDRCLAALGAQHFPPSRYEIIVVDDRPCVATREVVANWSARLRTVGPRIHYIANPGPHGPAAARNCGWKAARGSIIAFTDDDAIPQPDWLLAGMRAFDDNVLAVRGRIVMPLEGTPTDYQRDAKGRETAEFATANCFCPRYVLEEVGGFDERFRHAWGEDADLYFRLLARDGRIVHAPAAVVVHPIRAASWGISVQQQKKILSDALLYKKHPALYRQKIRGQSRWDYYLIVLSMLVGGGALLAGSAGVAAIAGLTWLSLSARICLARLKDTVRTPSHIAEMVVTSALIPPAAVFWRLVGSLRFRTALL
ncbi:MAG: glycosyltransferase [Lacisediminimonas sp.]|nr:glycosyltransferase [Lacisediminimonas sp.]